MGISVGTDIEAVARMARWLAEGRGLDRFFTAGELAYAGRKGKAAAQTLTGLFCAREAFCKAVGEGMPLLLRRDLEIVHETDGRPSFRLTGKTKERYGHLFFSLSIAHSGAYATATVVAIEEGKHAAFDKE